MARVVVLGGCGTVGSIAVKTLARNSEFSEVVIGDFNIDRAKILAKEINVPGVKAIKFDAFDKNSIMQAVKGADVVLNCVGPFYSTVKNILKTVAEAGINYVDVCDDVDVTIELLEMDGEIKSKGITALIGMGNSPGVTNIMGKLAHDSLLDETDSVDIFHAHGGEKVEGAGVIGHQLPDGAVGVFHHRPGHNLIFAHHQAFE